ncbi:MAG: NAD(P)H-dependent oxidoreductase [Vicinamibacterales bacterium]
MRAVLLSAVPPSHTSLVSLRAILERELAIAGYDACDSFELSSTPLAFCQGEFDCWVKTPGRCRSKDAEQAIVQAVHDADALVYLDAVRFGGYGHVLKTAIDRLLCLLEPFFTTRHALTHHEMRYARQQRLFSVGWLPSPNPTLAATFTALTDANAVNYLSPTCGAVVVDDEHQDTWASSIRDMLAHPAVPGVSITSRTELTSALMDGSAADTRAWSVDAVHSVSLLIGSPKARGTSASETIARSLAARFTAHHVETRLHAATEFVHDRQASRDAAAELAASDLFFLVTPLYVDAFPSLTTHALELIADVRAGTASATPSRFAMLINCGFPEAEQTRTAMRMARHFADEAGYIWAGGLPLGGGGVVTPETSLDKPAGPVAPLVRALDLAVPSLMTHGAIPVEATRTIASSMLPDAFYRLFADLGWRWQAHRHGLAQRELHARPLDQQTQ